MDKRRLEIPALGEDPERDRRERDIAALGRALVRQNAESNAPVLYYAPPGDMFAASEVAGRIVERGFEETMYHAEDEYGGVMLWAFMPDENDGVQGEVLVEVALDCSVAAYEEMEAVPGSVERTRDVACVVHPERIPADDFKRTGRFWIPAAFVNAHTISRRLILTDVEG